MRLGENHMKSISLVVCAAAALVGCTVNGASPVTAWGKEGVSMLDYRTDGGQCAVLAATVGPTGKVEGTAGGVSASNGSGATIGGAPSGGSGNSAPPAGGGSSGSNIPSSGGSTYRDSASADFVNRAAMQQRSQEMAEQQARNNALKSCLSNRGYTEFSLTAEQRAELAKLPQGSEERRAYLFKLGTNPEVLNKQAVGK